MTKVILILNVAILSILSAVAAVKCPITIQTDLSANAVWSTSLTSPDSPSCMTIGMKASLGNGAIDLTSVARSPGTTNCTTECSNAEKMDFAASVQGGSGSQGISASTRIFYFRCYDIQAAVDAQPPPGKIDPSKKDIDCTPNLSSINQVSWVVFMSALLLPTILLR